MDIKTIINNIYVIQRETNLSLLESILVYAEDNDIEPEILGKELLDDTSFIEILEIDCERAGIMRPHMFGLPSKIPSSGMDDFE